MESPFKLFIADGGEAIEIPRELLKYFGFFLISNKDSRYEEFSEHVDFPLDRQLWKFILSVYIKHDDLYGDDEPLKKAIDDDGVDKTLSFLDIKTLYKLVRTFDFYEMPLFMMVTIREVMRRLLCMTTEQLYLTHREMKHLNGSCTTVIETVVGDCARQSVILEILRNYVVVSYLVDMIRDHFIPRIQHLLAVGEYFSLVLTKRGVFSIGNNDYGQIARPLKSDETKFQRVALENVISVAATLYCSFFLTQCGTLYSAGRNNNRQLGRETKESFSATPEKVDLAFVLTMVAAPYHTMALTADGVYVWGSNRHGQLGNGILNIVRGSPERMNIDVPIVEIAASYEYSAMRSKSGDLYVCGLNLYLIPTKIDLPGAVKKMFCLSDHIVLLMEDDTLFIWCDKTAYGGLKALAPLIVPEVIINEESIFPGFNRLYAFGKNGNLYYLGFVNNDITVDVSATMISTDGVIEVSGTSSHMIVLKKDGLYGMGENGGLGLTGQPYPATPQLLSLVVGHEEFANLRPNKKKRKIDKGDLSCHVCGSLDLASLHLHTSSKKLFCDYKCLNAYSKPRF
jgi:hypothetical protein